jgi:MFS transporter, DHA2 family, multidrug resistance protein
MSGAPQALWRPSANLWLIAMSVMLPSIMEVLDTTMANVALPHMAGNLSASQEEATWVITSYLVSNAIVLPMTDWLCVRFGRKRFLMACVVCFTLASAWCGVAGSMPVLILARIIQGAAGGGLIPLSQAILMESAPPEKRGVAMAVFGLGVVVAPVIGPALGGWLTDNYSWRWMFLINVPVGALAIFMCQAFIEDPPYLEEAKRRAGPVDYLGFAFMAAWLGTLQIVLDKGQQEDWFETPWICWFSGVSVLAMIAFIAWELRARSPLVNLKIFANRDFALGTAVMAVMGMVLYGTITLQPLFLQQLMGYSSLDSGLALSPRGIGAVFSMILVGKLIGKLDNRLLIGAGFLVLAFSAFQFAYISLDITPADVTWPNVVMGLSLGLIFVPLNTAALGSLPQQLMGGGSGILNLMRNIGGSVGISIVTTMLARDAQFHHNRLVENLSPLNPVFQKYFYGVTGFFSQSMDQVLAKQKALAALSGLLSQQATLLAYLDDFKFMAWLCLIPIAGVAFMSRQRGAAKGVSLH